MVDAWELRYTRAAQQDAGLIAAAGLKPRVKHLLGSLAQDPYAATPASEKLVGDMAGCHTRRITIWHRLVYEVLPEHHTVLVLRMWTRG